MSGEIEAICAKMCHSKSLRAANLYMAIERKIYILFKCCLSLHDNRKKYTFYSRIVYLTK